MLKFFNINILWLPSICKIEDTIGYSYEDKMQLMHTKIVKMKISSFHRVSRTSNTQYNL